MAPPRLITLSSACSNAPTLTARKTNYVRKHTFKQSLDLDMTIHDRAPGGGATAWPSQQCVRRCSSKNCFRKLEMR